MGSGWKITVEIHVPRRFASYPDGTAYITDSLATCQKRAVSIVENLINRTGMSCTILSTEKV